VRGERSESGGEFARVYTRRIHIEAVGRDIFKSVPVMNKNIYNTPWFVYIAECRDKALYVGIARDAKKRIKEHNTSDKCRYTRFRKPLDLIYQEVCPDYNSARKRELEVKRFSRKKKLALIQNQ
jgi:putative endonuclease